MPHLCIKATNTGDGVFALSDIPQGTVVRVMSGERMTGEDIEAAIDRGEVCADDPFQIDEELFIKLDRIPYLFNHSCDPNTGVRDVNQLVALRDIAHGEELTYDYSTTVCTHSVWRMACLCGSPHCRHVIQNARSIPQQQRARYRALRVIPAFIERELIRRTRRGANAS